MLTLTLHLRGGERYHLKLPPDEATRLVLEFADSLAPQVGLSAGTTVETADGLHLLRWADVSLLTVDDPGQLTITRAELLDAMERLRKRSESPPKSTYLIRQETFVALLAENHLKHAAFAASLKVAKSTWSLAFNHRSKVSPRLRRKILAHPLLQGMDESLLWERAT